MTNKNDAAFLTFTISRSSLSVVLNVQITHIKCLTWHSVGFIRQQCANVAVLVGHNCDRCPSLVRQMKQNASVLPSKSCVGPAVVDIDLHHRLAQLLPTQDVADLDLKVKDRT